MFKWAKKIGVVSLISFIVLTAGAVGCGCTGKDFVSDIAFSSRLIEKQEETQLPVKNNEIDVIYHIMVRKGSDVWATFDPTIANIIERIIFPDSPDPCKNKLESPASVKRIRLALD